LGKQVAIGEPGQKTTVVLDTGSYELWVNPDCSKASLVTADTGNAVDGPLTDPQKCRERGQYDPSRSSSMKTAGMAGKEFVYGGGTSVMVNYVKDKLNIGGKMLMA
jgi:hypothetical protein